MTTNTGRRDREAAQQEGATQDEGFLTRWSRRKRGAQEPREIESAAAAAAVTASSEGALARVDTAAPGLPLAPQDQPASGPAHVEPQTPAPAPTLADVAALAPGDEISRFIVAGVDEAVRRAAFKKLFADPRFNVMDGLDTYIDDYTRADPIPEAMLEQMHQSRLLGLFDEAKEKEAADSAQAPAPSCAVIARTDEAQQPDATAQTARNDVMTPADAQAGTDTLLPSPINANRS